MPKYTFILFFVFNLLFQSNSYCQFERDNDYRRWRIHHTQSVYRPAVTTLEYGKYSIDTRFMRGYKVGFEYYFRHSKPLQYFTGLNMNFIPLDNYSFELPGNELGLEKETFYHEKHKYVRTRHNVFSVPIGIQYNKSISKNINLFIKSGLNIDLIQYGQYTIGFTMTNNSGIAKRFLEVDMISQYNNVLYPSIFIGGGIDYYTSWSKLHISLNIQKSIMPYMTGDFRFYNLDISGESYGKYKLNGDYIGLDIGITFKKFRKV